ncbi:MAG: ribonuclease HII [archaeon]|jgi:ribonuclease HII
MLIAGIDEAGRGPCFGPMSLAIAVFEKDQETYLKEIGVKDSKDLTPKKRDFLFDEILNKSVENYIINVTPIEINDLMTRENLNEIEAIKVAELINLLEKNVDIVYIDSPDATKGKYEKRIRQYLDNDHKNINIISEIKADSKYVSCSAASILAKVSRDREIEKIKKDFGDIGSGYPADPKTKKYLKDYVQKNKKLPPFSRIFWSTCTKALEEIDSTQSKLI